MIQELEALFDWLVFLPEELTMYSGLRLIRNLSTSASQVVGLKACGTASTGYGII